MAHPVVRDIGPPPPGWTPPQTYQAYTAFVLDFLADVAMGSTPAARLTALMAVLRMRRDGAARLIAEDFSPDRLGLSEQALGELITAGWLRTSLDAVRAALPHAAPAVCHVPALADDWGIIGMPKSTRKQFNGWFQRLCTHPLLHQQPAGIRLAALAATAASDASGYGTLYTPRTASRCCFTSRDVTVPALMTLMRAGWLTTVQPGRSHAAPVRFRLAPAVRGFAPGAPAADASPHRAHVKIDLSGRERRAAAWADDYLARHRHPPALRTLVAALHQENPKTPWSDEQLATSVVRLERDGWLIIDPHGDRLVRPGPAYTRRKTPRSPQPRTPATTPAPPAPPAHRAATPDVPATPDHGYVPDLPLRPASRRTETAETVRRDPLEGLWRIPGAQSILGPAPQRHTPPAPTAPPGRPS
ncbi:hypothetical protein ACQEV9_00235 [Streptomyces chartreusis]|uniref:hypothetical protein n=1 Tax=Streptomyces chartreusis TaxID=1969 RepID=UPI003D8F65B9